jgi:hypothetical protein
MSRREGRDKEAYATNPDTVGCFVVIHFFQRRRINRVRVQTMWHLTNDIQRIFFDFGVVLLIWKLERERRIKRNENRTVNPRTFSAMARLASPIVAVKSFGNSLFFWSIK